MHFPSCLLWFLKSWSCQLANPGEFLEEFSGALQREEEIGKILAQVERTTCLVRRNGRIQPQTVCVRSEWHFISVVWLFHRTSALGGRGEWNAKYKITTTRVIYEKDFLSLRKPIKPGGLITERLIMHSFQFFSQEYLSGLFSLGTTQF